MADDLGRFQRGDKVRISVETGSTPDDAPVATIAGPGGFEAVLQVPIDGSTARFARRVFLGLDFALGSYLVTHQYAISGEPRSHEQAFELVPGGDSGGDVISMHTLDRPEGRHVVAQLSGGLLVQGRNPKL